MNYTPKQQALLDALKELDVMKYPNPAWQKAVDAMNGLCVAIEAGEEHYDACFPPEIERAMDAGAMATSWLYDRIEQASGTRRNTSKRVKKALGYMG